MTFWFLQKAIHKCTELRRLSLWLGFVGLLRSIVLQRLGVFLRSPELCICTELNGCRPESILRTPPRGESKCSVPHHNNLNVSRYRRRICWLPLSSPCDCCRPKPYRLKRARAPSARAGWGRSRRRPALLLLLLQLTLNGNAAGGGP